MKKYGFLFIACFVTMHAASTKPSDPIKIPKLASPKSPTILPSAGTPKSFNDLVQQVEELPGTTPEQVRYELIRQMTQVAVGLHQQANPHYKSRPEHDPILLYNSPVMAGAAGVLTRWQK